MKTSVIGLFDEVDDARRVLSQLVGSPLDLGAIHVVSADPDLERQLRSDSGLPHRSGVVAGIAAGALLGAVLGAIAAQNPSVAARLGTVLAVAAGILIGLISGAVAGASVGRLHLPEDQDETVLEALQEGATVILVRTENVPTARAIRDLFQSGGSRTAPQASQAAHLATPAAADQRDASRTQSPTGSDPSSASPADRLSQHSRFAPPWRRGSGDEGRSDP